ncbi:MAG TPA: APC family permease [Acidobacteriaceae bacterium]|nr:APC family permease [Acidobacteriaceae bacterium]
MPETTVSAPSPQRVRIVVASTVMLTFISFWSAAAIVLNDLGSSAFYVVGIAEQDFGKTAPWVVLAVMLFSFAVRAVYVESCSMFTRGGVYRIVKEGLGGTFAKVSVSALMFDYVLTGPVSGVSAGQYIVGLLNELLNICARHNLLSSWLLDGPGHAIMLPVNATSAVFAVVVTIYYWWLNVKGIEHSSKRALDVMKITTLMVILMMVWGFFSAVHKGAHLPPLPTPENLKFSSDSFGFLKHTSLMRTFGLFGILMAFGHTVLAMSGEETLAQVNREIQHPKLKNLKRAAIVIALYSLIFTGGASLLAVMLIPDNVRVSVYGNNAIAGIAMYLVGPLALRVAFRTFVVVVGFLMLAGAINTSIIGSTGVLMRVAEDGVLHDWFRKPQKKFGTPIRIINLVTILQLATIILSRGDIIVIGEAYAFGVIWSFTFNGLAMLVLRYRYHGERGWKVPINLKIGKTEIPIGLLSVFLVLFSTALVNLLTKEIATISGIIFAATFYIIFTLSEKDNVRRHAATARQMKEHFQLDNDDRVSRESLQIRPGCIVVTMRDPKSTSALRWALSHSSEESQDVVVLTARLMGAGGPEYIDASQLAFTEHEQMVFTKAVSVAEGFGRHISLLVVPAGDPFAALVQTANSLDASTVVAGLSTRMTAEDQAFHSGQAWEALPEPKRQFTFYVVMPDCSAKGFHIGPHAPTLQPEDVELVHQLWLKFRSHSSMEDLHHSDIVTYALGRLADQYKLGQHDIVQGLKKSIEGEPEMLGHKHGTNALDSGTIEGSTLTTSKTPSDKEKTT